MTARSIKTNSKEELMFQGKWRQRIIFSLLVLALGVSAGVKAAQSYETDISGSYSCKGTNPGSAGGPGYHGTTSITKLGSTYLLGWTINGESFTGIGIRNGNILSVSWYASGKTGIV